MTHETRSVGHNFDSVTENHVRLNLSQPINGGIAEWL